MFNEVFERIKLAINTRTQVQLAEVLEIRQSSISDAKRRDSIPAEWYLKLFKRFGLNPDWLEDGLGPWYLKNKHGDYTPSEGPIPGIAEGLADYAGPENKSAIVTVHSMHCEGSEETGWSPRPKGKLAIPQSLARPSVQVIKMSASNMEPTLRRGAFVGIDTEKKEIVSGEIYAVYVEVEGLVLKRLFHDAEHNRFVMVSDNKAHPDQHLPVDKRDTRIYGRAVWVLQEL